MTAKKHLKMTNPGEVRRAMTRVSNMVLNGEITPQQANALIYAGNAVLSSIRADEQGSGRYTSVWLMQTVAIY